MIDPDRLALLDKQRGHFFFPPDNELARIPAIYATEDVKVDDKVIHLHYFVGSADWWIAELDPINWVAFGFACLGDPQGAEWGYIDLNELAELTLETLLTSGDREIRVPLLVERDIYWALKPFGEVQR